MKSNFLCLQLKYASSVLLLMVTLLNIVYFFQSTLIVKRLTMKVGLNREYSESHQIVIQNWTSTVNKNSTGVAGRYVFSTLHRLKGKQKYIVLYRPIPFEIDTGSNPLLPLCRRLVVIFGNPILTVFSYWWSEYSQFMMF